MAVTNPKHARRRILTALYESYQRDPLVMMTPSDIADASALMIDELAPNCHYLHDRELIELMMGYNPPLFAAARIAPEGIDLYEDRSRFEQYFSAGTGRHDEDTASLIPLTMSLARQAEEAPIDGLRRDWLLRDVTRLRELMRGSEKDWDTESILNALQWLRGFTGAGVELPALNDIDAILARRYQQR
jgi:hypothetical protein